MEPNQAVAECRQQFDSYVRVVHPMAFQPLSDAVRTLLAHLDTDGSLVASWDTAQAQVPASTVSPRTN
jgi:hypothetical protein